MTYLSEFKLRVAKRVVIGAEKLSAGAREENVPKGTLSGWGTELRNNPSTDFNPKSKAPKIVSNKLPKVDQQAIASWQTKFLDLMLLRYNVNWPLKALGSLTQQ